VCNIAGATEVGDFRATSLGTLIEMVAGGIGVTLVPAMAAVGMAQTRPNIVLIPFVEPGPLRTIGLVWRPSSPRTADFKLFGESLLAAWTS